MSLSSRGKWHCWQEKEILPTSSGRLSTGICLHCAFMKGARFDICLRKHVVAATGPSPFKVEDNQRPKRTMSGVRKPSPESSVPGENLTGGSRRNQLRRGHGSPPVLSEVPHELSSRYAPCVAYPSQNPDVRISRIRLFIRFIVRQFKRIYSHRF